jgi:putative SOS response-associated peptidase YedK
MCGRYSLTTTIEEMRRLLGFIGPLPNLPPRYNIAPTQNVPTVRLAREGGRELALLRWGLIPSWAKDVEIGARLINARGESVAEKPSFRDAFKKRRCLVPADGFYEWQAAPGGKIPHRVGLAGGTPEAMPLFAFAGLWEHWDKAADGKPIETCAIITTDANERLRPIHERMPVILAPEDYGHWLDPATSHADAQARLKPYPSDAMVAYEVSTRVNAVRNDDAACLAPAAPDVRSKPEGAPAKRGSKSRQPSLF